MESITFDAPAPLLPDARHLGTLAACARFLAATGGGADRERALHVLSILEDAHGSVPGAWPEEVGMAMDSADAAVAAGATGLVANALALRHALPRPPGAWCRRDSHP